MSGLIEYINAMLKAMAQRKLMKPVRIGPGEYKTPGPNHGKYTGEKLREIRATHGVGRPIPVKRITGDDDYAEVVPAERTIAKIAAWQPVNEPVGTVANVCAAAVALHGSQRKAAAALSMNLSTFQRALKKEQS